jgi:hypothetical protein
MLQSRRSLINLRTNYLVVFFIYLSIFINSYIFFKEPFEFYFGYLIYLLMLPVFIFRYGMNRDLLLIFFILLVTGIFNIFLGNNTLGQFIKVYAGLVMSYFFYYYVVLEFGFNIELLFRWYMKGVYIVSLLGLFQFFSYQVGFTNGYTFWWVLNKWSPSIGGNFGIRINSIYAEPTHLAAVQAGAFFVSVLNFFRKESLFVSRFQSAVIIIVYLLAFSGLGMIGIFLCLIFLAVNFGLFRYIIVIIPALIILFNVLYNNVSDFRDRYVSIKELFFEDKFVLGKTHGSSFILYNNYQVAVENFKSHFMFGTGIGSHPTAFDKYSKGANIKVYGFNLNSADANSMLLRLISETGLFGVGLFFLLIYKCYVRRTQDVPQVYWVVSNAILVMILLNLFRQGHYFLNGFPFFVMLYYFNWRSYKSFSETGESLYDQYLKFEKKEQTQQAGMAKIPDY